MWEISSREKTTTTTYLLLELLVNGIQGVFDRKTLHVASGHAQATGPNKINLLEWWSAERDFEKVGICDRGGIGVDLPVHGQKRQQESMKHIIEV